MNPHHRLWSAVAAAALVGLAGRPALAADPVPTPQGSPANPAAQGSPANPAVLPDEGSGKPAASPAHMSAAVLGSLDGIWMFDPKQSDDPMKAMQAARAQNGGGEGGGRRGGGGFGGGGFGGGRRGGGEGGGSWGRRGGGGENGAEGGGSAPDGPPRGPSPMSRVMRPARKVVIDMQADQVLVTEDDAAPRPYAIADSLKAHQHELLTENTSALWRSHRLEMTQTLGARGRLVETYELSRDGTTLTIRARREGGPEGSPSLPEIARVYTRYEGD